MRHQNVAFDGGDDTAHPPGDKSLPPKQKVAVVFEKYKEKIVEDIILVEGLRREEAEQIYNDQIRRVLNRIKPTT